MKKQFILGLAALFSACSLSSCLVAWDNPSDDGSTPGSTVVVVPGIPSDNQADPAPVIVTPNIVIPGLNYVIETVNGNAVIRLNMNGIQNPNEQNEWLRLLGTATSGQNCWITVDNQPKGIAIINTIDQVTEANPAVDLVFLVDNSGSMSEEANTIARDIIAWANKLSQTLDIQFGCVGYDGAITGAIDITSATELSNYLERYTGTSRTRGFADNAAALQSITESYRTGGGSANECGVAALRFAQDNFTFRTGANKIYVNFTDEYNQPNGNTEFSTEWVKDNWNTVDGTIHTVYSNGTSTVRIYYQEEPWLISDYTGGTILKTNSSFTGITLDDLPVTGALQNSYIISFTNFAALLDGQPHTVKITIYAPDGSVQGEKEFQIIFN